MRGDPSNTSLEGGNEEDKFPGHASESQNISSETVRKPVTRSRKVKKHCDRCVERKAKGGNKAHHCGNCEYFDEHKPGARRAFKSSATPGPGSATKTDKIYCEECMGRKNSPGENGRSRHNAKHECADCQKLRDEAGSQQGPKSNFYPQLQTQFLRTPSETIAGNRESVQIEKRKQDGAPSLRAFKYQKVQTIPGQLEWVRMGPDLHHNEGRDEGVEEGSEYQTDYEDSSRLMSRQTQNFGSRRISPVKGVHTQKLGQLSGNPWSANGSHKLDSSGAEAQLHKEIDLSMLNRGPWMSDKPPALSDLASMGLPPELVNDSPLQPVHMLGPAFQPWGQNVFMGWMGTPFSILPDLLPYTGWMETPFSILPALLPYMGWMETPSILDDLLPYTDWMETPFSILDDLLPYTGFQY